jgi:membrane-bound ClpP family serine protease
MKQLFLVAGLVLLVVGVVLLFVHVTGFGGSLAGLGLLAIIVSFAVPTAASRNAQREPTTELDAVLPGQDAALNDPSLFDTNATVVRSPAATNEPATPQAFTSGPPHQPES